MNVYLNTANVIIIEVLQKIILKKFPTTLRGAIKPSLRLIQNFDISCLYMKNEPLKLGTLVESSFAVNSR